MFKRNKDIITLDIGSTYTKVVIGSLHYLKESQHQKALQVKEMFKFETPKFQKVADHQEKTVDFIPHFDEQQLATELKKSLNDYGIKTKNVALVLGGDRYITRDIVIPKVSEDKILDMLTFEIEEYLPVAVDQYVIDYIVQGEVEQEGNNQYKVLVAALEKREAKYYYDYLKRSGYNPTILDAHFNGLSKLMPYMQNVNDETIETLKTTVGCVDLGAKYINVSLFNKGKLELNRSIDNTMQNNSEDVPIEQIDFDPSQANVLSNIERIFKFYTSRLSKNNINHVFVYGGGAENQAFVDALADQLNQRVITINQVAQVECLNSYKDELYHYLNAIAILIRR
jgi:type IV pilus assembly protein PilM